MTPAPREVATGLRFPEGPVAMPDGSVILVEIESQHLTRVKPGGAIERIAHLGGGPCPTSACVIQIGVLD